jgi:PAS domain S-box-containing protein
MKAIRRAWLRSTGSARVAVPVLVVLLSVAGYLVTTHAVSAERRTAAERRAAADGLQVQALLARARAFAVGLGNALEGERVPDRRRFAALQGSATTTVGLTAALWVEHVSARGRDRYERRLGAPITRLDRNGRQVRAVPAAAYLPATFVTGVALRRGVDVSDVPSLSATLRDPASIFAGTATPVGSLGGRRGFFVVQGARFGRGPGSHGFLVVFVPAGWLSLSLNASPQRTAILLDGRRLEGALRGTPAAEQRFEALTRRWRVAVAGEPATALQATLPWLVVGWPPATALLVYLLGRGMLRRRRAEREVDDIFDLSLDLLCIGGLDGYFKRVNPAFERTLGYQAAELLSRPFLDFVHPADREATQRSLSALGDGRKVLYFENRYVRADGAVRWLQWNTRPMPDKGLVYGAARDVTDIRILAQEQAALRRVATLVAHGDDPAELFDAVAIEVGRLLSADATRLLRYESDGTATVVASYGGADAPSGIGARLRLDDDSVWGRVADTGRAARTERLDGVSDPLAESLLALAVNAAVAAPIVVSGRPWGVIVGAWKQGDLARDDTEIRMAQFTELVATAVANAESRAELTASRARIVATADETRRRIERDLHDGTQQRLVSLSLALRTAEADVPEGQDALRSRLSQVVEGLVGVVSELQEVSRGLHPAILSRGGLGPALKSLARRSGVPAELEVTDVGRLPEAVEVAAYYIVAEALTNAAKHAHASVVWIAIDVDDSYLRLVIRDDGVGGADPSRGSGLIGLQDRVAALGGTLAVRSEPGAGTALTVHLPVASESAPQAALQRPQIAR